MADVVNKTTMQLLRSVNTPDYPSADWLISPAGLATLLSGGIPSRYWKLTGAGDDIEEMTTAEKAAVDDTSLYLDPEKDRRIAAINAHTENLIETNGFEFPPSSGNCFALDAGARENWSGLAEADDRGLLSYPQSVGTKDFDDYEILDAAAFGNFYATALGTVKAQREAGQALRKQIRDATTRAAVDAVVDNRT
jgi:hypothetical protein